MLHSSKLDIDRYKICQGFVTVKTYMLHGLRLFTGQLSLAISAFLKSHKQSILRCEFLDQ